MFHFAVYLYIYLYFGLVLLRFKVLVNNFSVMSGRSHRFLGITRKK